MSKQQPQPPKNAKEWAESRAMARDAVARKQLEHRRKMGDYSSTFESVKREQAPRFDKIDKRVDERKYK